MSGLGSRNRPCATHSTVFCGRRDETQVFCGQNQQCCSQSVTRRWRNWEWSRGDCWHHVSTRWPLSDRSVLFYCRCKCGLRCHLRDKHTGLSLFLKLLSLSFRVEEAFFPGRSSRCHNSDCTFASRARLQHGGHFGEHSAQYQISVNCVNSEESLRTPRLCLGQLTPWMTPFWLGSFQSNFAADSWLWWKRDPVPQDWEWAQRHDTTCLTLWENTGIFSHLCCLSMNAEEDEVLCLAVVCSVSYHGFVLSPRGLCLQACMPKCVSLLQLKEALLSLQNHAVCISASSRRRRNGFRQLSLSLPYVVLANDINHCLVSPPAYHCHSHMYEPNKSPLKTFSVWCSCKW